MIDETNDRGFIFAVKPIEFFDKPKRNRGFIGT